MLANVILSACTKDESPCVSTTANTETVENLKNEISSLSTKVSLLSIGLTQLQLQHSFETAILDPSSAEGYQRMDANIGTFLVRIESVEPYLDGQKVTLMIGNPNFITFSGFKLNVKWGLRIPDAENPPGGDLRAALDAFQKSTKEKEVSFTESLIPGMWNRVQLTISPASANELGRLEVSMQTNQVSLIGDRARR